MSVVGFGRLPPASRYHSCAGRNRCRAKIEPRGVGVISRDMALYANLVLVERFEQK